MNVDSHFKVDSHSIIAIILMAMFVASVITLFLYNWVIDFLKKEIWREVNRILYAILLVIFVEFFITQFPWVVYAIFLFSNIVIILQNKKLWGPLFGVLIVWWIFFELALYFFDFSYYATLFVNSSI